MISFSMRRYSSRIEINGGLASMWDKVNNPPRIAENENEEGIRFFPFAEYLTRMGNFQGKVSRICYRWKIQVIRFKE